MENGLKEEKNASRNNSEWHRTFTNQTSHNTITTGMVVVGFTLVTVVLCGVVFYLIKTMVGL